MPKKGSAKFSALKGTVQGTLSHRSSAHHSPRGKMQNIVPQKGSAQVSKRDSAEQSAPKKGSAQVPQRASAEQSTPEGQCHKNGSTEYTAQERKCPNWTVQSTVHKCPKSIVPKKG